MHYVDVKSTERLYTKGVVYNGYIQICKKNRNLYTFFVRGTLTKEWPISLNPLELKEDRSNWSNIPFSREQPSFRLLKMSLMENELFGYGGITGMDKSSAVATDFSMKEQKS